MWASLLIIDTHILTENLSLFMKEAIDELSYNTLQVHLCLSLIRIVS